MQRLLARAVQSHQRENRLGLEGGPNCGATPTSGLSSPREEISVVGNTADAEGTAWGGGNDVRASMRAAVKRECVTRINHGSTCARACKTGRNRMRYMDHTVVIYDGSGRRTRKWQSR